MLCCTNGWEKHLAFRRNKRTSYVTGVELQRDHPSLLHLLFILTPSKSATKHNRRPNECRHPYSRKSAPLNIVLMNTGLLDYRNLCALSKTELTNAEHFRLPTCPKMYYAIVEKHSVPSSNSAVCPFSITFKTETEKT